MIEREILLPPVDAEAHDSTKILDFESYAIEYVEFVFRLREVEDEIGHIPEQFHEKMWAIFQAKDRAEGKDNGCHCGHCLEVYRDAANDVLTEIIVYKITQGGNRDRIFRLFRDYCFAVQKNGLRSKMLRGHQVKEYEDLDDAA
jgi:hypothetical protein